MLNEAKNAGDAEVSARLFNEVQCKICSLQPFDDPPNKSTRLHSAAIGRNMLMYLMLPLKKIGSTLLFLHGMYYFYTPISAIAQLWLL